MSSFTLCETSSDVHKRTQHELRSSVLTNKDASRWRPTYHLISTHGWLNDPCAPGFIPAKGTYHVGFQWNANGAEWGDIVWGNAFSKDLVTWDVTETPILQSDRPYDHAAVFTGCWIPTGIDGRVGEGESSVVTVAYTSVTRLPIHYTREYHRGCESLSLATSRDGGKTWTKLESNPILPGPLEGIDATGWRDPYVAHWPAMRKILDRRQSGGSAVADEGGDLFGIISGGVRNQTPTNWLYRINPRDLSKWEYVAPLIMPGVNFSPSRWTGDLGLNWEVTNFMTLEDEDKQHTQDFLVFGAEGCKDPHGGTGVAPGTKRCNRAQLWIAIDENTTSDAALTKFSYGGIFDHGLYYAANGFWDPATKQQIIMGWVTEDDLPVEMQVKQGWSGCLSLPRVATLTTIKHVSRALASPLGDITSIKASPEEGRAAGLYTIQTLKIMPDSRLEKLRLRASKHSISSHSLGKGDKTALLPLKTAHWEAHSVFSGAGACKCVGIKIHHKSATQVTLLYFSPQDETFVIERPDLQRSTGDGRSVEYTKLQDEKAPFTLFTVRDLETGIDAEERLDIRLFYDTSVLEVYVNERAVITTRVYLQDTDCSGIEVFAERLGDDCVLLEEATIWDGLEQ
ncbi:putative beta-Fructufuranosidase [Gnomoniopsis sp. IMI 355080]|nr:putative beta-Fructufuranosidase [Gnomoniopsis sp. IMI 355080]